MHVVTKKVKNSSLSIFACYHGNKATVHEKGEGVVLTFCVCEPGAIHIVFPCNAGSHIFQDKMMRNVVRPVGLICPSALKYSVCAGCSVFYK